MDRIWKDVGEQWQQIAWAKGWGQGWAERFGRRALKAEVMLGAVELSLRVILTAYAKQIPTSSYLIYSSTPLQPPSQLILLKSPWFIFSSPFQNSCNFASTSWVPLALSCLPGWFLHLSPIVLTTLHCKPFVWDWAMPCVSWSLQYLISRGGNL